MPERTARALGFVLHPLAVGAPVAVWYAIRREGFTRRLLLTGAVIFVLCAVLPLAYVALLHRIGIVEDIKRREDRRAIYPFLLVCLAASLAVFWLGTRDPVIHASAATALVLVAALGFGNRRLKISFHVAGTTAVLVAALFGFGPRVLPLLAVVPVLAWARVRSGHHTLREVLAGFVVGTVVPWIVMRLYLGGLP